MSTRDFASLCFKYMRLLRQILSVLSSLNTEFLILCAHTHVREGARVCTLSTSKSAKMFEHFLRSSKFVMTIASWYYYKDK